MTPTARRSKIDLRGAALPLTGMNKVGDRERTTYAVGDRSGNAHERSGSGMEGIKCRGLGRMQAQLEDVANPVCPT